MSLGKTFNATSKLREPYAMIKQGLKIAFVNDSCEHLGVEYISALLKSEGHDTRLFVDPLLFDDEFITVKFLNRRFDYTKRIVRALAAYQPDLIGMSVVSSFYPWASQMAGAIKAEMNVPIIMGGIHPTSVPERVIQNNAVDMICLGEGEYPMLELAHSMARGEPDSAIKNIWFKKNGQIIRNPLRPLLEDLDALPFADKDLYYSASPHFSKSYYIAASRGCPHACSYCCNSYLHSLYKGLGAPRRSRSVHNVIEELVQAQKRYRTDPVFFLDDCFGTDLRWLKEFAAQYREKIGIKFYCMMFPSLQMEEAVGYLAKAGCGEIEIGVQSWDEDVRRRVFNRRVSNDTMIQTMKLIRKADINLVTGDILGYPGQKEEHILKAAEIYTDIKPSRTYAFILKYFPKTQMTEQSVKNGSLKPDDYEKILDGHYGKYLSKDGSMTEQDVMRYLFLFLLVRILPPRWAKTVIRKRLYKRFPVVFTPAIMSILNNFSTSTFESRVNRRSALARYTFFIKQLLFNAKAT